MKNTHKKLFSFAYAFTYISQAAFCMVSPAAVLIFLGLYIQKKAGAGGWLTAISIVIGVLSGFYCMINYLVRSSYMLEMSDNNDRKKNKNGIAGYQSIDDKVNKNNGGSPYEDK